MSEESEVDARSVRVSNFLVKKDKVSALAASLQNPPVNEKSEELKVSYFILVTFTLILTYRCEFLFRSEILPLWKA